MSSRNLVILLGRLGKDPEVRHFENGGKVANFSLATSERWTDKSTGEIKENVEWHNISVFGKKADIAEKYLKKGDMAYLEGKLKTRTWEKDGVTKYITEVVLEDYNGNITLIGGKTTQEPQKDPTQTDDLPF